MDIEIVEGLYAISSPALYNSVLLKAQTPSWQAETHWVITLLCLSQ